jgi:hypothetical protein
MKFLLLVMTAAFVALGAQMGIMSALMLSDRGSGRGVANIDCTSPANPLCVPKGAIEDAEGVLVAGQRDEFPKTCAPGPDGGIVCT